MDAREEAAILMEQAVAIGTEESWLSLMIAALHCRMGALDEDLLKLRKELRTRNGIGGEDGS